MPNNRKLTQEEVAFIRSSTMTHRAMAALLGISDTTVGRARRGDVYEEMPGAVASLSQRDHIRALPERVSTGYVPEPNCGCWLWLGSVNDSGYGAIVHSQEYFLVHRYSYEMANGPIPPGLNVLHKCDVRCCINPEHLFLGTQADNIQDMVRKKRHRFGESSPVAKLTESAVRAILTDKRSSSKVAAYFGVSGSTVLQIRKRKAWRHINVA